MWGNIRAPSTTTRPGSGLRRGTAEPAAQKAEIRFGLSDCETTLAKFDGILGKALLTVTEKENELTLVFADNRFLFVSLSEGKIKAESVPE